MNEPKRASDLLKGIMRDVRKVAGRSDLTAALLQAVGPTHAGRCRIAGFSSGKLVVEVDSAPLYAELSSFRREEIRQRMNQALNQEQIAQIVFRMGGTGHV